MSIDDSLRYKSVSYTVHTVLRRIHDQSIDLYADFKDSRPWPTQQRISFIESIFLGIPTQPIWCEETIFGQYSVIDGSERLRTICDFMNGKFELQGLKINEQFNGKKISDLPYHAVMQLEDRYQLPFIVIDYDAEPILKREFFRRLNWNDNRVYKQSARNFAYRSALNFLREIRHKASQYIGFKLRRRSLGANEVNSRIEEVFLMLLLFLTLDSGHVNSPEFSGTVEDSLDDLMGKLDNESLKVALLGDQLHRSLIDIFDRYSDPAKDRIFIELASSSTDSEDFLLPEFYQYFLQAIKGKLGTQMGGAFNRASTYSRRPARLLIKDIKDSI